MLAEERFDLILKQLERQRTVTVQQLCEVLNTSESTIRRDLTELDRQGRLNKVHGGATLPDSRFLADEPTMEAKETLAVEQKRSIAQAAAKLMGERDFQSFCDLKNSKKSTVRRIDSISLTQQGQELLITVTGNGFLQNMVRILVGTLVEVGTGQRGENLDSLFGQKREKAGFLAPSQGLCLMEVTY